MSKIYSFIIKPFLFTLLAVFMNSCFTGVEGTGKITLSKKDESILIPSEEEVFLADCYPSVINEWIPGKKFFVTDEKFRILAESETYEPTPGDTIIYKEIITRSAPDGSEKSLITFRYNDQAIFFPLEKSLSEASKSISANDIPFLLDLDMIDKVKSKLINKEIWTRSALWYNDSLQYIKGKKFYPVTVTDIKPGNSFFPLLVSFISQDGQKGAYLMSMASIKGDNRSFNRLFSLSDPKLSYKQINPSNWEAIQNENLIVGMTKEECRLSKGNPSDIEAGHNYSNTMEIWVYPNGSLLRFVDGVLIDFK